MVLLLFNATRNFSFQFKPFTVQSVVLEFVAYRISGIQEKTDTQANKRRKVRSGVKMCIFPIQKTYLIM